MTDSCMQLLNYYVKLAIQYAHAPDDIVNISNILLIWHGPEGWASGDLLLTRADKKGIIPGFISRHGRVLRVGVGWRSAVSATMVLVGHPGRLVLMSAMASTKSHGLTKSSQATRRRLML